MENMRIDQSNINSSLDANQDKRKNNQPAENEMDRRAFLRLMGASLTVAGAAAIGIKFTSETTEPTPEDNIKNELEALRNSYLEEKRKQQLENALEYINIDDMEIIGKTFREQIATQNHITLNEATRKAIYHNWQEKYTPGSINYEKGLVQGLERMRPWISEIKKIFAAYAVPEEYVYLAIAESHFSNENISRAGAVGPYQITKSTSQLDDFKMTVNASYDERLDPLKSAELCAKHLRYSYEKLGKDWDLALLAYNGGYTNDFIIAVQEKEGQLPGEQISSQGVHILQSGETLSQVAQSFETSLTLLYRKNAPAGESFKQWIAAMEKAHPGEILEISQKRTLTVEDFYLWLEGEINVKIKAELTNNSYVIASGDNLRLIAKKFNIDLALLKSLNPDINDNFMRVGQKLHIPAKYKNSPDVLLATLSHFSENINYPGKFHALVKIIQDNRLDATLENAPKSFSETRLRKKATLKDISRHEALALDNLLALNPAIKSPALPLPMGFVLRIPNTRLIAKVDRQK